MTDKKTNFFDYNSVFSLRNGYESLPKPMRLERISKDLRRDIWSVISDFLEGVRFSYTMAQIEMQEIGEGIYGSSDYSGKFIEFTSRILERFLRKPKGDIPADDDEIMKTIEGSILKSRFNHVLDLIEIVINDEEAGETLAEEIKDLFGNKYNAAYRLDTSQTPYQFFPCASKEQCDAIQRAIETVSDNGMQGASAHLRQAATHINKQEYGDSMVDSIHAVESVARAIDPNAKRTLGPALDSLEQAGLLKHPALKDAFKKLYGYTCDGPGMRHALIDKDAPDVGLDEALFMFGACASFAAYLVSKHQQAGQSETGTQ